MNKTEILEDFHYIDPCEPERKKTYKWAFYGKNKYCPKVKITNWWYDRETYPRDYNDPLQAAYLRFGTSKEDKSHWVTETMETMEAGRGDPAVEALKNQVKPIKLLSFLNYPITLKTRKDLLPEEIRQILPSLPKDQLTLRYATTNQSHYKKVHILSK